MLLGMMHQSSFIQVTRTVKALLKWPLLLHTSNSLLGGRGQKGFINDLERYPHCDWLKTSYSANEVTFCKYAPGTVARLQPPLVGSDCKCNQMQMRRVATKQRFWTHDTSEWQSANGLKSVTHFNLIFSIGVY